MLGPSSSTPSAQASLSYAGAIGRAAIVGISTRLALFLIAYLAIQTVGFAPGRAPEDFDDLGPTPVRHFDSTLLNLPYRWDAGWYLGIAMRGYEVDARKGANEMQRIVFFPAFPMAIRLVARPFGKRAAVFLIAGTVLSNIAFIGALAYLYLFAREHLDERRAGIALWLLACYPFSFFYGAVYTESLFLLCVLGAFHHLRRDEVAVAAGWALLAGLTKPNGFLLTVPLALLAAGAGSNIVNASKSASSLPPAGRWRWAAALAPLCGVAIFSTVTYAIAGDPLIWLRGQRAWGRQAMDVLALASGPEQILASTSSASPYDVFNAAGVVFAAATLVQVWRRLGAAYGAFILITIVPPLVAGGLMSQGRFSSVLFPSFVWLAGSLSETGAVVCVAGFAAFEALAAILFYTWRPLF